MDVLPFPTRPGSREWLAQRHAAIALARAVADHPSATKMAWPDYAAAAARKEAWQITTFCNEDGDTAFRLYHVEDNDKFFDETQVWEHVLDGACNVRALCVKALTFLAAHSPSELDLMERYVEDVAIIESECLMSAGGAGQ